MFVVGTVLYRNLGSFLALQRWEVWPTWKGRGIVGARAGGRHSGEGPGGEACPLRPPSPAAPDTCWLCPRNTTVLNSKVISVTVKPPPRSLLTPLEIEFAHLYNVSARTQGHATPPAAPCGARGLRGSHFSLLLASLHDGGETGPRGVVTCSSSHGGGRQRQNPAHFSSHCPGSVAIPALCGLVSWGRATPF